MHKVKLLPVEGSNSLPSISASLDILRAQFTWIGMRKHMEDFFLHFLLYVIYRTLVKIPFPTSSILLEQWSNEVLHLYYLWLGFSSTEDQHVLVIKDDFEGYWWISAAAAADSSHYASQLSRWISTYTAPVTWVLDQESHFINEKLRTKASDYWIKHLLTVS